LAGNFPRAFLASERPMAIACLRLLPIVPEPPDLSSPRFISYSAPPRAVPAPAALPPWAHALL